GHAHLDSLTAKTQRRIDGLAHGTAKRHAFFELQSDRFRYELGVEFGLVNLLDVDEHFALGLFRKVLFELFDLGAFTADDDAGTRCADSDAQLVTGTIHFYG